MAAGEATTDVEMAELLIHKGPDASCTLGGLRFEACRREVDDIDGGVTLYVWSTDREPPVALLRFDLFRERPHYHAPAEQDAETKIDAESGESVAWGIDALTSRAAEFIEQAGESAIAASIDQAAIAAGRDELAGLIAGLEEPNETSTFAIPRSVLDGLAKG